MDGSQSAGPAVARVGISAAPRHRLLSPRRILQVISALLVLIALSVYGRYYWTTGRYLASTDDATVAADSVIISPKVSGYLSAVLVDDNQVVHARQTLARIDDRDYLTALAAARAQVDSARAAIDNLEHKITQQKLAILEAQAVVTTDQAALAFSQQQYGRYAGLARTGAATVQDSQQWQTDQREKEAGLARDTAAVGVAQQQVDILGSELAQAKAVLAQRQAMLHQAELNVSYTSITAPVDGTVGDRTLRVGQYVQAGTQLMAVVPLSAVYITANYEETQLTYVQPGQPVTIDVDTFPDATVRGVVNSISPASGEEFALLPPDNATGNFTKIVQRIPVKITIDPHDPLAGRLRPGMSVEPTINTRPKG
ncbi:MAG TPA: HlyD family secretion protein [Acetobacteraceae bacterium]|nr:HlyD family secretion protein [Acetobacteraceae bacterium]